MLCLEISQIALVNLPEIVIVGPSRKIVEDDEHRDHTAVFHDLASDRPLVVAHFTVAPAEVLVPLVVRPVHTSSVAAVGSRFIHTFVALIVGLERVRTAGAEWGEEHSNANYISHNRCNLYSKLTSNAQ